MVTLVSYMVCDDCLMLFANAEVTDSDGNDISVSLVEKISRNLGTDKWNFFPGDLRVDFSKTPCETCGEPLAGSRNEALGDIED